MGRLPKQPHEKARSGRRAPNAILETRAPKARSAIPSIEPPDWLQRNKEAMAIWQRIAPDLHGLRLIAQVDADVFGRYCFHFAEWLRLSRLVQAQGEVVDTPMTGHTEDNPKTMLRINPLMRSIQNHEAKLIELEDRFGGNPIARYRLVAQSAARPGAFGALFDDPAPANDSADDRPASSDAPAPGTDSPIGFGVRHIN